MLLCNYASLPLCHFAPTLRHSATIPFCHSATLPLSHSASLMTHTTKKVYVVCQQLRLYQVLHREGARGVDRGGSEVDPADLRLLQSRRLSAHRYGWEVFKVSDTVRHWVNASMPNYGDLF